MSKHTLRRLVAAVACLVAATLVAACSSSGTTSSASPSGNPAASVSGSPSAQSLLASGPKTIAWGDAYTNIAQFKTIGDEFTKLASAHGIQVKRFDNKNDPSAELANARLMVQAKPDIIFDWSSATSANVAVGKMFNNAHIPCVAILEAIPGCYQFGYAHATMGAAEGPVVAKILSAKGWTASDLYQIFSWGPNFGDEWNNLARYFYMSFAQNFPGVRVVQPADIPLSTTKLGDSAVFVGGGGDLETTYTDVSQALQSVPQGKDLLIFTSSSAGVLGTQRALTQDHRDSSKVAIWTSSITADGAKDIRTGNEIVSSGETFFVAWPKYILSLAYAIAAGQKIPSLTQCPLTVVTQANIGQYFDANGNVISVPPLPAVDGFMQKYLTALGGPMPS